MIEKTDKVSARDSAIENRPQIRRDQKSEK